MARKKGIADGFARDSNGRRLVPFALKEPGE